MSVMYGITVVAFMTLLVTVSAQTRGQCAELAEAGDCSFYETCVQPRVSCAETDYPLAYGSRYCNLLESNTNSFSSQGQEWITEVKSCFMKELLGHINNPGLTCSQITKIALDSHLKCYLENGFCDIIRTDMDALCGVYDTSTENDHFKKYWKKGWKQLFSVIGSCYGEWWGSMTLSQYQTEIDALLSDAKTCAESKLGSFNLETSTTTRRRRRRRSIADYSDVEQYAADGDCKFWEAFELKFPCKTFFDWSAATSFMLPSCVRFDNYFDQRDSIISVNQDNLPASSRAFDWMLGVQQCVMAEVLPEYESSSVNCLDIDTIIQQNAVRCIVEAGFCDLHTGDESFLHHGLNAKGFPAIFPTEYTTRPLTENTEMNDVDYYYLMRWFKPLLGDANIACYESNQRDAPLLYDRRFSKTLGMEMKFRLSEL